MQERAVADAPTEIDLVEERVLYEGFRRYTELAFREENVPEGRPSEARKKARPVRREILQSHRTVAVLAYDGESGDLVLIRQFRIGAHLATGRGMLVEIVAGYVDEDEAPETAARRELAEETGLAALEMTEAARFLSSPGMTTEYVRLYVARVDASELAATAGTDADERVYPFRCSLEAALDAAGDFAISNVFTLLALNWYARNRSRFHETEA